MRVSLTIESSEWELFAVALAAAVVLSFQARATKWLCQASQEALDRPRPRHN